MIQNQVLLNKRQIRFFKYILLSPLLEQISLIAYLLLFFFIMLFFVSHNFHHNPNSSLQKSLISKDIAFFANNISIPRFHDWLSTSFQLNYLNTTHSLYKLFGSIRITQYRLQRPEDCYTNLSSIKRFSLECNPFFSNEWTEALRNYIKTPVDSSLCIEENCQEFNSRYMDFLVRKTDWKEYPTTALYVTIPLSDFQKDIQKIHKNNWFSANETIAIICEFNSIDLRFLNIYPVQIFLEMPGFSEYKASFRIQTIMFRIYEDVLYVFLIPIFLFLVVVLLIKGIFEYSYFSNKTTCILNIMTYSVNLIYATCLLLENAEYSKIFLTNLDEEYQFFFTKKELYPLNKVVYFRNFLDLMMLLCLIPYPYKFFELISWNKDFHYLQKFFNCLFRTFLGFSIYVFSMIIVSLCWTFGLFIFFKDFEPDFQWFSSSFLSHFFSNSSFQNSKEHMEFDSIDYITISMKISRSLLLGFFIAIMVFCVFKASSFEYWQFYANQDKEVKDSLISISGKIDRFVKKYLPNLQQDLSNKSHQIIVWLNNGALSANFENEIIEKCKNKEIKLLIFTEVKQIIQFMSYLFKLKPNIAFRSENFFRIVIEISRENPKINQNPQIMLKWLMNYGSRVPVLLFGFDDEMVKTVAQRWYKHIYLSQSIDDVKDFMLFKKIAEIRFKKEIVSMSKLATLTEMDSSIFSHSFEMDSVNMNNDQNY